MQFLRRDITWFVIALIALALSACGTLISGGPTPIPSPSPGPTRTAGATLTSLPMITPVGTPDLFATPHPQWPSFPRLCDITHSYWLKPGYPEHFEIGGLTRDGKYYIEFQRGRLVVLRDVASGKRLLLTDNGWLDSGRFWSPQGDRLIFAESSGGGSLTVQADYRLVAVDLRQGIDSARRVEVPLGKGIEVWPLGWSPDGAYLALRVTLVANTSERIVVWSAPEEKIVYDSGSQDIVHIAQLMWSKDSRWFAFFARMRNQTDHLLTTVDITTVNHFSHRTPGFGVTFIDSDIDWGYLLWSPDSSALALILGKWAHIYRPDVEGPIQAAQFPDMLSPAPYLRGVDGPFPSSRYPYLFWQSDSRALLMWNDGGAASYRLDRLSIDRPGVESLVTTLHPPVPASPPTGSTGLAGLAFSTGIGPQQRINVMKPDGSAIVPIAGDASEVGTPVWSPDGQTVAVVWTQVAGSKRSVFLSWANSQGDERHVLGGEDFTDIKDVSWSRDSQVLTLVAVHGSSSSVEMVDIGKSVRHVLLDGLIKAVHPPYDDSGAYFAVRWEALSGQGGYDGYDWQGNRLFSVLADGDPDLNSAPIFSPDRKMAAVKVRLADERLEVARTDGSPPVTLKTGLTGLGNPLWSPDSRLLAFTMTNAYSGPIIWQVVDTAGHILWTRRATPEEGIDPLRWNLEWAPCPP